MTPVAKYLLAAILAVLGPGNARSDEEPPARPSILFNRWQENWSVLADPNVAHEPLDDLKYIPLGTAGYLSLGADLRERFESNDAANFADGSKTQDYVISRLEAHADLRLGDAVQAFVQIESAFSPGKTVLSPVDQDRLDLEQAFIVVSEPLGEGLVRLRIGRQQFAFDLQRFVSARDGPNVRQSYDAIWGDYEWSALRLSGFYSQPVQSRDTRAFDDFSSRHLTYGGVRAEYEFSEHISVSAYVSEFRQDNARFPSISGNERRSILDVRFAGSASGFDWDAEAMGQGGVIAEESVRAWAIGTRAGYTIDGLNWNPRVGLQFDAASGDSDSHDSRMGTFNPLFPNGSYLTLAGYTGYTNFIHLKPSLTLRPVDTLTVMLAAAAQWRQTTADAVYTQPDIPVAGTAGRGGAYTGSYAQTRIDWQANPHLTMALEAVRFDIGSAIRQAGGRDATYLGLEGKLGW